MLDRHWHNQNNCRPSYWSHVTTVLTICLLAIAMGLGGCQSLSASSPPPLIKTSEPVQLGNLREVSPPKTIQALASSFNQYQPQVTILSPAPDTVLKKTTVAVKLRAEDLPLNQNDTVPLRAHVHLILDNEPYRAIYNLDQPIVLEDLEPGTHTLRAFPVRPWHESYKNDGAYAQVTFHVLTKTDSNNPDSDLPLLTYSRPKGDYGAEPILLDYYLTNAPLHIAATNDADLSDWRIRVTVNDESFLVDQWQPIYLEGFETGENWLKLEFIDEAGNLVANRFNNTVRVINYQPDGQDAFSRLMRGDVPLAEAYTMVGLDRPFGVEPVEEAGEPEQLVETAPEPAIQTEATESVELDQQVEVEETEVVVEEVPLAAPKETIQDLNTSPEGITEENISESPPQLSPDIQQPEAVEEPELVGETEEEILQTMVEEKVIEEEITELPTAPSEPLDKLTPTPSDS
ncbi:slr1624 [Synechocystis sp. PCC 6803]|uniref:Slr1624 protein n=1 Tax=Synechocystis sp. (strain ATCC 27184 / PCC 6803 / Kazusa) TaxID=1111708 RepID=P74339_SYNY3|nr:MULTISPECIES: Ig-like domain-containing protein [unclassified Synechocystis]MBD2640447.1 Ig-like domain-containing protein [Synechocystis sp. FACHB-908]BAM54848.1 hypothetical protein BEST7613_5917 [Synechocystis sp. PCC 6803] [Bacillus subtilis BEST7613]AGF52121.1 hypothetical protein MYO_118760 [Synechocystis sp. PCC 6803]ALJ68076.1 hypothetical protein AOY38_09645 [Synechocystis sp. PCC 6803]AVP89909.1 hypothetical protein C7I86_09675 [Synechocystis sp. IPPAS B-1465]